MLSTDTYVDNTKAIHIRLRQTRIISKTYRTKYYHDRFLKLPETCKDKRGISFVPILSFEKSCKKQHNLLRLQFSRLTKTNLDSP
jgi:hypothetical protein